LWKLLEALTRFAKFGSASTTMCRSFLKQRIKCASLAVCQKLRKRIFNGTVPRHLKRLFSLHVLLLPLMPLLQAQPLWPHNQAIKARSKEEGPLNQRPLSPLLLCEGALLQKRLPSQLQQRPTLSFRQRLSKKPFTTSVPEPRACIRRQILWLTCHVRILDYCFCCMSLSRHTSSKQSHVFAAARINARQATSTRVAFSDDEDAEEEEPKVASWKPKPNLVTPAKPKSNPIPSAHYSRGPTGSTSWTDAVCDRAFVPKQVCFAATHPLRCRKSNF
jgi:hypothetical protein